MTVQAKHQIAMLQISSSLTEVWWMLVVVDVTHLESTLSLWLLLQQQRERSGWSVATAAVAVAAVQTVAAEMRG